MESGYFGDGMNNKVIHHALRALAFIFILTLVFAVPAVTYGAQVTTVSVSVPDSNVQPGQQFTINVTVATGSAIAGAQFSLAFNPAVVTVNSVVQGGLFTQGGASTYFSSGTINNNNGTISKVFGIILGAGQSVSQGGTLATINMTAGNNDGICALTLSNVVVGDPDSQPVTVSVVSNSVTVGNPSETPTDSPASGGGGGGGGGGGSNGATNLTNSSTQDGRAVQDITATDADNMVKLFIPQNTFVTNTYGQAISSIIIIPIDSGYGPNPGSQVTGTVYSIQPSGTTFDPLANLTLKYDPAILPPGASEKSLYIALWDPVTSTWTDLGGTVDTAAHTISLDVQHLSIYTVMTHTRPADFKLSGLTVDKDEVDAGSPVTLSVTITNTGDFAGTYQADLKLDGAIVESKTISLGGLENQTVEFTISPDTVGKHDAGIGDLSTSFTVNKPLAPADFLISNLSVSPSEVNQSDNMDAFVLVMNTGDLPGSYRATLNIDDVPVQFRDVQLDGGQSELVDFNVAAGDVGQHTVSIDGLTTTYSVTAQNVTKTNVNTPVEISEFSVNPLYNNSTGKLESTRISYTLSGPTQNMDSVGLSLKVFFDGSLLEEIPLHLLNQQPSDDVDYTPSPGWQAGRYTFLAILQADNGQAPSLQQGQIDVSRQAVSTVVSWKILGIIIGITMLITMVLITVVVMRRKDMLRPN
jgi:hypothetical protein